LSDRPQIAVLISGSGSNLQAILDACISNSINADLCLVLSNREDAFGLERAKKASVPTLVLDHFQYQSREDYDTALVSALSPYKPDLVILAGFMRILTPIFTESFAGKLVNIHPSLLPKYPGLNTHQRALEAGDTYQGATVHFVTHELDGGPPILQGRVKIRSSDTAESLAARILTEVEHKIYPLAVQWLVQNRVEMRDGGAWMDGELLGNTGFQYIETGFNQ
jgi:phosphoribosylglycinamide formyltransferase-1|tara:strand:+ start:75046 stop:75714 length:669 start_codon:yes stop_codon:yes gene_type:complete